MTAWRTHCEERVAHFENYPWPPTTTVERRSLAREVRRWRRRLWWATRGRYVSAIAGALLGTTAAVAIIALAELVRAAA